MKKKRLIALVMTLLLLCSLLTACGGKSGGKGNETLTAEQAAELSAKYAAAIEGARSAEDNTINPVQTEDLDPYMFELLGVKQEDVQAAALSISMMNVKAYGIAAIRPVVGREQAVADGLKSYVELQKQNFEQYLADQYEVAKAAKVETLSDGTVLLVMCEDADTVFASIKSAIEK